MLRLSPSVARDDFTEVGREDAPVFTCVPPPSCLFQLFLLHKIKVSLAAVRCCFVCFGLLLYGVSLHLGRPAWHADCSLLVKALGIFSCFVSPGYSSFDINVALASR